MKIKIVLKGQLITLIRDANLKSSLSKAQGFLLQEVPTTRLPNRQRWLFLERSSEIFASL